MLGAGANHVTMTYWPELYFVWAAVSIAALFAALAGLLFGKPLS
jgi:hypothetical protein